MARSDKQLTIEERYKKKMDKYKEAYKERTDFASKFKLDPSKTRGVSGGGDIGISTGNGDTGSAVTPPENTTGTTIAGGSELGRKIAEEASKWVGKCVYRWGGKNPESGGADCSGFTSYIYKKYGNLDIGISTTYQNTAGSQLTPREKALPGDLIMFQGTYRPGVSHVGIVYSWPKIVHCAGKEGRDGVQWGEIKEGTYWAQHYLSVRRVISDNDKSSAAPKKEVETQSFNAFATVDEIQASFGYTSDEDGMDMTMLMGNEKTSTPGAPDGWYTPPLHWIEGGGSYKAIETNRQAGYIYPAKGKRESFFHERIGWGRETGFKNFKKLDEEQFVHISRHDGLEGNMYCPDAISAFEIFYLKSKREKLEILSGFRFSPKGLLSPHEAGCAIDIRVYGYKDARELADIAWSCGFRAIAIGGDIENDAGFIHLDIGPSGTWGYDDMPAYAGPGRWY